MATEAQGEGTGLVFHPMDQFIVRPLFRDIEPRLPRQDEVSSHVIRHYGLGAQILSALGLSDLVLLSNSAPVKVIGLDAYGLSIHSTRPIRG